MAFVTTPAGDELTTLELLVLVESGDYNDLGDAYGAIQLYAVFEEAKDLDDATESALLRLFDLGFIQCMEVPWDVAYEVDYTRLPPMSRDQLVARLAWERDGPDVTPVTRVFYDATPAGEAVLRSVPRERIPQVSGNVRRPWLNS